MLSVKLMQDVFFLAEKCDLMEQQGSTYQDQLAKRKQMIGDIEANLRWIPWALHDLFYQTSFVR